MCQCDCQDQPRKKRRCGLLAILFQVVLLYVALVFSGGTLARTGNPVAAEAGRLIHTVLLVEPSIRWAEGGGHRVIAGGLRTLADGIDFRRIA